MDINKETARRLWNKQFGKKTRVQDFAGRTMDKSSYNDRNSEFGWNVDHILPESRGGKTADHNLICCHILTNDEKADRFPGFKANGTPFVVKKRENHYEIFLQSQKKQSPAPVEQDDEDDEINFLDYAQGLDCWKHCRQQPRNIYMGYVKIQVSMENESASFINRFCNFLDALFNPSLITHTLGRDFYRFTHPHHTFTIIIHELPFKSDFQELLDHCIILNTYSQNFFNRIYGANISIYCGAEVFESATAPDPSIVCDNILNKRICLVQPFAIDNLVRINTDANDDIEESSICDGFYPYDQVYIALEKNLQKHC